jgi:hypothetical protein
MRLTRKLNGCKDDACPAIWETSDPAVVAVQGAVLTDAEALCDLGQVPAHETVVLIPREFLAYYRADGR